jgi:hypothetical protein
MLSDMGFTPSTTSQFAALERAAIRLGGLVGEFSRVLGWGDATRLHYKLPAEVMPDVGGQMIVWYEAGDRRGDCFLQVNLRPTRAAVYAIRFGVCTGWHEFRCTSPSAVRFEAVRLAPILHARWLSSPRSLLEYGRRHPLYTGYTWERIRSEGYPGQFESQ